MTGLLPGPGRQSMGGLMPQTESLENELREIIFRKIQADTLDLPSMPSVAGRCLGLLRGGRTDFNAIAREVERDPIVAAYVLRQANSAAQRSRVAPESLGIAIAGLGSENLRLLFLQIATRVLFESRDPRITQLFLEIWRHSVAVAILARSLASVLGRTDSAVAYEAGLLHDVGKPIIAMMLLQFERTALSDARVGLSSGLWLQAVEHIHRFVAIALARRWNLPETVTVCIENSSIYEETDVLASSNIVRLANVLAKRVGLHAGPVDLEEVDTLINVGQDVMNIPSDVIERVTLGIRERVGKIVQA